MDACCCWDDAAAAVAAVVAVGEAAGAVAVGAAGAAAVCDYAAAAGMSVAAVSVSALPAVRRGWPLARCTIRPQERSSGSGAVAGAGLGENADDPCGAMSGFERRRGRRQSEQHDGRDGILTLDADVVAGVGCVLPVLPRPGRLMREESASLPLLMLLHAVR